VREPGDVSRPERSRGRVTATGEEGRHERVAPTRKENDRPRPPIFDEGGDRRQAGHHSAGGRSVRVFMRSRSRLRISPRTGASERSEVAPGAGKDLKTGGPRQSARSVCLPTARSTTGSRPSGASAGFAVAEQAATPEDRQSERSDVCRDQATEKYQMPEGRAGRRAAVVRPAPEAGREPHRGGRAREADGRKGGAQPGPDGRRRPRGRAGEKGAAGGAPRRKGATPRRDPGDCNALPPTAEISETMERQPPTG